ncbi:MAG: hypothetical protein JZD41_03855 [Thermoproteus sp.]|nr:hypothetical protein [Thermoproteus sp.]
MNGQDVNDRRRLGLLMALLALGAISAFATLQFLNVTIWAINATKPPVQKYAGPDVAAYPNYIKVASYVKDGLNVTYIYVLGYTGDITNYTDALQVCNKYGTSSVTVSMRYVGPVGGLVKNNPDYVKQFVVYYSADQSQWVGFTYTETRNGPVPIVTSLEPGQCVTLGVSVLVSGDLSKGDWSGSLGTAVPPNENTLAIYQVDIITSPSQ